MNISLRCAAALATLLTCLAWPVAAVAQQNGRFAALKTQAFDLFQRGRYAEVVGKLEEIWEQDKSDPKVAQYLAMGYMYGERKAAEARPVMEQAILLGVPAIFLLQHSHERLTVLNGNTMNQYCTGQMRITPGKMEFVADATDHSVTITPSDLKEFKLQNVPGRIQIKAAGKTYVFRVKSDTRDEAVLLGQLAEKYLTR